MSCDFLSTKILISPQLKITKVICFTFILWMLSKSFYTFFILELKQKAFLLLADGSLITDAQQLNLLKHERGGIRRIGGNGGRSITKSTLGDRSNGNGR